ncbi:hypothetical protein C8Q76DRAFT_796872 [Earliella scabrosa]|nr:hypothetical protein C8Q76DRAFT_796872 [Earliella scabrosa]
MSHSRTASSQSSALSNDNAPSDTAAIPDATGTDDYPTNSPLLNEDILDLIIEEVTRNCNNRTRQTTLYACALTCRDMVLVSLCYLYHDVVLFTRRQCACFARTISDADDVAAIVRQLTIELSSVFKRDDDIRDLPLPPHVIARLSNLRRVDINGMIQRNFYDFYPSPPTILAFILQFSVCPVLEELNLALVRFESFADAIRLVWSFPTIRSLTFVVVGWNPDKVQELPDPAMYPGHCRNLTSLTLRIHQVLDLSLQAWGTKITSLHLSAPRGKTCMNNLEGTYC